MNAYQRRVNRRSYRYVTFDLESLPTGWGTIHSVVVLGDFFDIGYLRPQGNRLSDTITVLKAREAAHSGAYAIVADMDFTKLEERIAAMHPEFEFPYGGAQ